MKLTMKDVFLIRTQEYKDIHYFLGSQREAVFFYYKDMQKKDVHNIRMIYYIDNISIADYDFFKFIIDMRKQNMIFEQWTGIVPPQVNRSKTNLYSFENDVFKLTNKGIDVISFMKDNPHLKTKEHLANMNNYDLIKYHVTCFKFWMVNQNG